MNEETKTPEEIQALKDSWLRDPIWDIEDTEGFEAHREELLAFHKEQDAICEKRAEESRLKRAEEVKRETGVDDIELAQVLSTFREIEWQTKQQDKYIGDCDSHFEIVTTTLQQEQVRATLLLAAQVKRVADLLEDMNGRDSLAESARIWGGG